MALIYAAHVQLLRRGQALLPLKSINIRLSPQMAERFDALKTRFGGLPPSTVVRFLIVDALEKTIEEQVEIVNRQIHKPAKPASKKGSNLNSNRLSNQ